MNSAILLVKHNYCPLLLAPVIHICVSKYISNNKTSLKLKLNIVHNISQLVSRERFNYANCHCT